jgi:hypothetical protein
MDSTLPLAELANLHFVTPKLAVGGDLSSEDEGLSRSSWRRSASWASRTSSTRGWSGRTSRRSAEHASHVRYLHHGMDDAGQQVPARVVRGGGRLGRGRVRGGPGRDRPHPLPHGHQPRAVARLRRAARAGLGPGRGDRGHPAARPQANVWYAADALDWYQARTGVDAETAEQQRRRWQEWRDANRLDVVRLVREANERQRSG